MTVSGCERGSISSPHVLTPPSTWTTPPVTRRHYLFRCLLPLCFRGPGLRNAGNSSIYAQGGFAISEQAERGVYVSRLSNTIADSIVAKAEGADFIVMGHDRRGRLESLIKGSVAEKVVRAAVDRLLTGLSWQA